MVNHQNRKLTPARRKFLEAAIADEGRVFRSGAMMSGDYWLAGSGFDTSVKLRSESGVSLSLDGLIERVKKPGTRGTERWKGGFLYRITDAGRAALGQA